MAELFGTSTLLGRLAGMMESLEHKAEEQRARADMALGGLRDALVALLDVRGLPVSDAVRERLRACDDVATLQRWLLRATTAKRAEDVVEE